jgi:hypothetical protein
MCVSAHGGDDFNSGDTGETEVIHRGRVAQGDRTVGGCLFPLILSAGSPESTWIAARGRGTVAPVTDRAFNAGLQ